MSDEIDSITIVGGGDAGLLTALCIRKVNPGIDIRVIDDMDRPIPQVAQSTFWKIYEVLHEKLDIDPERFVQNVKPVWKNTLYFRDWCGYQPFHYPFDEAVKFPSAETPRAIEHYYYYYNESYRNPDHRTKNEEIVEQGKCPWYFDPSDFTYHKYEPIAYHLDVDRFVSFLREVCRERGISLVNDTITGVDTRGNHVRRVKSETSNYVSDLYVDATGFTRAVKGELDDEWQDFDVPLDSAISASFERPLSDVVPATAVESGDHGWFWHIDTYEYRDIGYVFASEYVSTGEAKREFVEHCEADLADVDGAEVEVTEDDLVRHEFDSGYFRHPWQENCIAIGNSVGFVEPLQSTGLTINVLAADTLSNLLSTHGRIADDGIRDTYNDWVRRSWESTLDFIAVHYKFGSGDTDFWQDMQVMEVSDRVELIIDEFDRNGFGSNVTPVTENKAGVNDLLVFYPENFYNLMRNMGATSEFYEDNDFEVSERVKRERENFYQGIKEDVESYLTIEELYSGILGESGLLSESGPSGRTRSV